MSIATILDAPPDLLGDSIAFADQVRYEQHLEAEGVPHICLTCGARQQVDVHSQEYQKFNVICSCGKHCLPEDEITPELAGVLCCKRAGAQSTFQDTSGHVWMYERIEGAIA